jgi:hypothetical protein
MPRKEESENSRVFTGELMVGLSGLATTDLALIRGFYGAICIAITPGGSAFGSRPNAWDCVIKSAALKLLNQQYVSAASPKSTSAVIKV